jgi:inhibitor of KinA sporulation pathway (predicted exonuclease)
MYICVIDFEATCWENKKGGLHEIIQFPSVLYRYSGSKWEYVSEFNRYCKPKVNPTLSDFCKKLTGIKQEEVDGAKQLPKVIYEHEKWLKENIIEGEGGEVIFMTCGKWDFEHCLRSELGRFKIKLPPVYSSYINIKDVFKRAYRISHCSMVSMLDYLKIPLEGHHHNGLDDSRNIGSILKVMSPTPESLREFRCKIQYTKRS